MEKYPSNPMLGHRLVVDGKVLTLNLSSTSQPVPVSSASLNQWSQQLNQNTMQAGDYAWMTYREVCDVVIKLAASMSKSGVKQVRACVHTA